MGNRAVNWLNQTANNILNRTFMDNPVGQRIGGFLNSGYGQDIDGILARTTGFLNSLLE